MVVQTTTRFTIYTKPELKELAERLHCSFQNVSYMVENINQRLKKTWETRDTWRIEDERNKRNKQYSSKNKRRS